MSSGRRKTEEVQKVLQEKSASPVKSRVCGHKKSARRGSNPRPPPWQGGAPPLSHSRMLCMSPCIEGIKLIIFTLNDFREAGDGNRTHVSSLEGWCSTIELHPHAVPRTGIEPVTRGFSVLCSTD